MTRTVVHLLRHGEVRNPRKILYGRLPGFGLSEAGATQAEMVAAHLAGCEIAHVVASPLQRAQETAAPIAERHDVPVSTDDGLIEATSAFEGHRVSVGDGALFHPRHWHKLRNPFRPSWGEPYSQVARRMLAAAQRARAHASGAQAVCVSHQLPIWTLRQYLAGRRLWHHPVQRQCALVSLTSLVFTDDELVEVSYTEPGGSSDPRVAGA